MTEPARSSPGIDHTSGEPAGGPDHTEAEPHELLDPTLARPDGQLDFLPNKTEAEPNFGPPEKPGEVGTLGRYRVLKKLGQGGMGAVYLSYDVVLGRRIALKVVLPQKAANAEARERFLREARAAAMVKSDHVVTIFDVGEERGVPFIAMEYLSGHPLDQYLKVTGELPPAQVFRVGIETALGLAAAHQLGLVHRDVKPGNLWLEAPHGRVKLLDFGLARAESDDTHLTTSGLVVGTPAYMSPEQARGLKLDGRSDLFSLGVMLYRLATGKMPFSGTTTMAVLTSLAVDAPVPARQVNATVSATLEAVISKLLAKNADDRYQTAEEVVEALRAAELPQPLGGQRPVVVAVPLAIAPQTENVWEGIEGSGSSPRVLEAGTEEISATGSRSAPKRTAQKPSKWPALLAVAALILAVAVLAAVLLWPSKKPPVVEPEPEKPPEKKHKNPVPDNSPDRKAAEFVLEKGGEIDIVVGVREHRIKRADGLPSDRFVLTGFSLWGKQIRDPDMAIFKECRSLTRVALHDTSVGEPGLGIFKGTGQLEHLALDDSPLTNVSVGFFEKCQDLRSLSLQNTPITDEGVGYFAGCKKLTHLRLSGANVSDKGLAFFRDNKGLIELALNGTHTADETLACFASHAALREVEIAGTAITDAGLVHARNWTQLRFLNARKTRVTAEGVKALAEKLPLCRIEWDRGVLGPPGPARKAAVYACEVGGFVRVEVDGVVSVVKTVANLPDVPFDLVTLNFSSNAKVTDAGLAAAEGCKELKELFLNDTRVTDAGLVHFAGITSLTRLDLGNTGVTDAGLAYFSAAKNLTSLSLDRTNVGDAGLAYFAGCTKLTYLDVRKTNVTTAKTALARALPGCRIDWNNGTVEPKK